MDKLINYWKINALLAHIGSYISQKLVFNLIILIKKTSLLDTPWKEEKKFLYKSHIRTFSHSLNPPEDRIPKKPVIKKKKKQFESCILYYNRDEFEIISKSDVLFYRSRWCVITHGIPITCDIHCKRKLHFTMDILCFYFSDYKIRFIFLESSTIKKIIQSWSWR